VQLIEQGDQRRQRSAIRKDMRARRRALNREQRAAADRAVCRHVESLAAFRTARRVGIYLAFDGEPDLQRLIGNAVRHRKQLFVPVLKGLDMHFAELPAGSAMARNFFGIMEPEQERRADVRTLDLVLTPLVAFDPQGARLGVGRGYYDRCFAFLRHRNAWVRPKLLGVAYGLQEIPAIELQPWDVTLWGVVTESGARRFPRRVRA
jgi:5-formyltetrahydrofolate cyclo-ligase